MSGNCLRIFLYHTAMLASEIHHLKIFIATDPRKLLLQTQDPFWTSFGIKNDKIKNKSIYYTLQAMFWDQKSYLTTHQKETLQYTSAPFILVWGY